MNREVLERAFPPTLVKSRQGSFGRELLYVEAKNYIERLNEAFNAEWSFEVALHEVLTDEVLVLGRITACGVTKQAFGGSSITKNRTTGDIVSIADDLKAAATDALKKAASLFGVGLHLYGEDAGADPAPTNPTPPRVVRGAGSGGNGSGQGHGGLDRNASSGGHGDDSERLTSRQLSMIWSLARERQIVQRELRRYCMETFGKQPEFLAKSEASTLIDELQSAAGRPPT